MTSLYSNDIISVLFKLIIKLDYKNKYLVSEDDSNKYPKHIFREVLYI